MCLQRCLQGLRAEAFFGFQRRCHFCLYLQHASECRFGSFRHLRAPLLAICLPLVCTRIANWLAEIQLRTLELRKCKTEM